MMNKVLPISFLALLSTAPAVSAQDSGQTETGDIVLRYDVGDVADAMSQHFLDVENITVDGSFVSVGGRDVNGMPISATLHACNDDGGCKGIDITAVFPATSYENAMIIEHSLEQAVWGIDSYVDVTAGSDGTEHYSVIIKTYIMTDGGVAEDLLSYTLETMKGVMGQTHGFMLKDDPAHEALWKNPPGQYVTMTGPGPRN